MSGFISPSSPAARHALFSRPYWLLWALFLVNAGIELVLLAADYGLIGSPRWRAIAYYNGAFWVGLLHDWRPNYPAQPWVMFITHAFLHGGFWHMATNMFALWSLGTLVIRQMGPRAFALIYFAAMIGGGIGFALLGDDTRPMVGASGAIFGLIGAWMYQDWHLRRRRGPATLALLRMFFVFFLLNLALWVALEGNLAWQTHLGGFVAGWGVAALLGRLTGAPGKNRRHPREGHPEA